MFSSISTPVVFVLALVIGLLVGLLVSSLFNREPKSPDENPVPEKFVKEGYAEAARILYTPAAKKVVTFLDGDYYESFDTLTPDQKKRVLRLITSWGEWGGTTPKPQTQPVASIETEKPATPAAISNPEKLAAIGVLTKPSLTMPPLPAGETIPGVQAKPETLEDLGIKVPSIVTPIPAVISLNLGAAAKIPEKPKTIVDQINTKLDEIMAGTPNSKKGIYLEDNGHQGVTVWVGLAHYSGVDAVPDPDVKAMIKEAVTRWEEESEKK
jgi:hypothetical protein